MNLAAIGAGVGGVFIALAVCGAGYASIATWMLWRFLRRAPAVAAGQPSISVLRPMHGDEPELYENLVSLCAQHYAGPVQIIVGAQDPADPALSVAAHVKRDQPDRDIALVADAAAHGTNRKISNLINMSAEARGEVVIISDSDVSLPPDGFSHIVGALEETDVGLVYCLYRGRPTASLWSKLAAMDVNTRFAPSVVVGQALGAHPVLGPTMALRAEGLSQIGGLPILADVLADDFELGRAVRAAGRRIVCPNMLIDHVFPERSAGEMLAHELRWARTVRLVQPAGYLGSVIIHFTALALVGAVLAGFASWSLWALAAFGVFRQLQAYAASRLMGSGRGLLWLLPVRDLISFGVFIAAIFGDRVEWRGNRLRVRGDGVIAAT